MISETAQFIETRAKAETVRCPYCDAEPGETCVTKFGNRAEKLPNGFGDPLRHLPAHISRIGAQRRTEGQEGGSEE